MVGGCPHMQQVQKSACRLFPMHFPIFPCSPDTILNLEPRVRTYYPTFYYFTIISEVGITRLKTTGMCRKLWKTSLVAGTTRRKVRQRDEL